MSKQTPSQDSNSEELENCIDAYKRAAEYDDYLFGDYDYYKEWLDNTEGQ